MHVGFECRIFLSQPQDFLLQPTLFDSVCPVQPLNFRVGLSKACRNLTLEGFHDLFAVFTDALLVDSWRLLFAFSWTLTGEETAAGAVAADNRRVFLEGPGF